MLVRLCTAASSSPLRTGVDCSCCSSRLRPDVHLRWPTMQKHRPQATKASHRLGQPSPAAKATGQHRQITITSYGLTSYFLLLTGQHRQITLSSGVMQDPMAHAPTSALTTSHMPLASRLASNNCRPLSAAHLLHYFLPPLLTSYRSTTAGRSALHMHGSPQSATSRNNRTNEHWTHTQARPPTRVATHKHQRSHSTSMAGGRPARPY